MKLKTSLSRIRLRHGFTILISALLMGSWSVNSIADVLVGAGNEIRNYYQMIGPGESTPPTQVFDVDTVTGVRTNSQYVTQRGPGSFTALDRDSSGTLWAIHEPNRLVTVDETTGVVTDVVELTDNVGGFLKFPAIAFIPAAEEGDPDRLFAIAKVERRRLEVLNKENSYDGFVLVQIDVVSGIVTQFGMGIGGQYSFGSNPGHGLEFDSGLGLIHLWNESGLQGAPLKVEQDVDYGPQIEIIDPETGVATLVANAYSTQPAPLKTELSELPRGFQAIVHGGSPGLIYAYDRDGPAPELYAIQVTDNGMAGPTYTSSAVSNFPPVSMYFRSRVRAMERRLDGGALLIENNGILEYYEPAVETYQSAPLTKGISVYGFHDLVSSVATSIGGYRPDFRSLATDPITGSIFALSSRGSSKGPGIGILGVNILNVKSASTDKMIEFPGQGPLNGLYVIDRNGPAEIELDAFDVGLIDPGVDKPFRGGPGDLESALTQVEAIAFDDLGVLYGITYEGYLVTIDLTTGVVTEVEGFFPEDLYGTENRQLDFNPEDGKLYLLYHSYMSGPSGFRFASFARDGSGFADIPLPEEFSSSYANSLIYTGNGSFIFSDFQSNELEMPLPDFKDLEGGRGSYFYDLTSAGSISTELGFVDSIFISALTKLRTIMTVQPDVLIGPSSNRLTGDGVYSPGGSGQSISIREKSKRLSGQFFADVENDGNSAGVFSVTARGGKRSDKIRYFQGGGNVTAAIKRGYSVSFAPGEKASFQVKFSRVGGRKLNENFRFSAANGGNVDTGIAKVKIKLAKKLSSGLKPENLN